jgi:hypothetical protein
MFIKIPKEEQRNLIKLLNLEDNQHDELISILRDIEPILDREELIQNIISKIKNITKDKAQKIIPTIIHLSNTFYRTDLPLEEFIEKIFSSIDEIKISEDERKIYKERLIHFLDLDRIKLVEKSSDLLQQNENTLCGETKIYTDLRPVFSSNPKEPPIGFLLVHKLKIQYINNDEMKEFFISMDTKDIQSLKEVLDRADAKAKSLASVINKTTIPYIEVK